MTVIESLKMGLAFTGAMAGYPLWLSRTRPPSSSGRGKAGDIDIFFKRFGAGNPVLLLHGGFMFAQTWAAQFPALSRSHLVIAPRTRAATGAPPWGRASSPTGRWRRTSPP